MKNFFCLFFIILQFALYADYQEFEKFQTQFTREEIDFRIQHYLQKSPEIANHYLLSDTTFSLFANKEDKIEQRPEFVLKLAPSKQKHSSSSLPQSLKDLRIAIDPGHLGGDFAIIEERYVKMITTKPSEAKENIFFKEGTLALMTALLLKQWLEAEGAKVFLTKEKEGQAVYEKNFFEWLAIEGLTKPSLSLKQFFSSEYNRLDLDARARKINDFHPHLTLIIHYNAHGNRHPVTQENSPEDHNYNMVFIGGAFRKEDLKSASNRYEFLRLLLTDDVDQSLRLSQQVIQQLALKLNVPPVTSLDPVPYLAPTSLAVGEGIYARNLALTRLVHGPLCYGETLCQDHREECVKLNAKDLEINNIRGPKRVEQVARAYFEAVKAFINGNPIKDEFFSR
jgi:N-acetylmuramoyl-L-alanine amidase